MATRKAGSRLETEIERCRSECQWERIPELVKQLSAKLIANDDMAELLLGESKLEQYLKEHPLRQGASPRGPRPQLTEVRKHLTAALDRGNLKSEFLQESSLIMAKLNYVEGDYKEALNIYARGGLDDLPLTAVPPYRLRLIAEAYATKGLCLEKLPVSSSTSNLHVDREQDVITCYEKAGDIALLYLQEIERVILTNIQNRSPKPGPAPHDQELGFFLETGLQRAHVLYFKNGIDVHEVQQNLTRGVGRFREILRAVETRTTQNLRMTIARQLAEILLRGMCEQSYWNPLEDPPCQSPLDDPLRKGANTKTYTLPRKARVYSGENIFCPQENTEEALLLLLISESMANRDAVLSRIPEHKSDRLISLQSASVVYDLLTIALGRRGQYEMLSECLERAMKFAFEEFQLWYQFALSLMAAGKSARAVKVLKECIRLKPDDATIPLLAAKLCVGSLHWLEEAEKFAKTVVDAGEKTSEFKAKGYLALGLTYSLQATDASLRGMQEVLQRKALLAFQRAHSLSPTDHQAAFYLALQLAISRQIPEALGYVRQALQLQGDDANSLHLLALLLSAQKHYHDALNIIDMALSEYPENFILLFSKVKVESLCRGPDEALLTCKHMLQIWKSCYNLTNPSDSGRGSSLLDRTIADRRQLNTITLPDFSDPETVSDSSSSSSSLSRTESPLHLFVSPHLHSPPKPDTFVWPPAAHSFNDPGPRQEPSLCNSPEVYFHGFPSLFSVSSVHATSVAASRVEQALSEVASSLQSSAPKQGPLHPWMTLAQIWLHAAEVYIGIGKPAEATACTQEAANLFPMSHNVLYMRGQVAELRGNLDEARRWYEEALSISPTHVKSMQRLALILHQLGRYSLAEKILRDAVQVNSTAHEVWNGLGEVLQAQGNDAAATECFLTALELEASSPAVPFTIIPRVL
ncbi:tetratricopeptide repeat protein 7B isoform X1 [Panthera pardus]|nr:tetratricopeptide repeat protein 7B isoform X1 [Panthera pardus]XP_023111717.1 tetratricopeptide repeat protein 7B isoform X4 [Felis catus]XP_042800020.1 tetratricopeptide repeat protein 7B isoform X10 [Panthera leo]XP_042846309.1 tetratricopeptide repeat protein 7B isoform X11 [Panthera tigris]XP_043412770.1 tetratricopeptide repeat protein 7B isoform X4 [Prionailurus bengalensis]XP_058595985.1 tetratricopeptide repeat protein 7B isoform X1 [Neofelis nebulosa]